LAIGKCQSGQFFVAAGRPDAAIAAYERALKLDPLFTGAYVNLADVYRQQGREDEGEKQFRRGLALLPNSPDLHHALGLLLVRQGNLSKALQELGFSQSSCASKRALCLCLCSSLTFNRKKQEALSVLDEMASRQPTILIC